uniref:Uncharacterized protein orf144 n=1 Tax=Beta vulgaris subsp. maritima TaxID=350892 RepID=E8ZC99_BETVM|nr:hypothetical protein [Beta vulgaris subsp. maritima]
MRHSYRSMKSSFLSFLSKVSDNENSRENAKRPNSIYPCGREIRNKQNSRENANLSDLRSHLRAEMDLQPKIPGKRELFGFEPSYLRKWTCSLKSRENESGDGRLEGEDRKALLLKHGDSFSGKKKERQSSTTFSRSRSLNGTLS